MEGFQGQVRVLVRRGQVGRSGGLWRGRLRLSGGCGWPLELWFLGLGHPALGVVPLWASAGGHGGVGPGGGRERDSAGGGTDVIGPLPLLLRLLRVVLLEADVPGQAADRRHRLELVDDVPWDEVDVVVTELDMHIANAFPPQLVELGVVHPLDTLAGRREHMINLHFLCNDNQRVGKI